MAIEPMNELERAVQLYLDLRSQSGSDFAKFGLVQMRCALVHLEESHSELYRVRRELEAEIAKARQGNR